MSEKKAFAEDEINLRDNINVLIKRKSIIFTIFCVSVITTTIFSFLVPKTYLSVAVIQNGVVGDPLINKSEVDEVIKFYDFLNPIIEELKLKTDVEKIKKDVTVENIKDTDFLQFKVEYKDKDTTLKLLRAIVNSFLTQANSLYQQRLDLLKQRLEIVDKHIKSVQADIERTQKLISDVSSSRKFTEADGGIQIIILQNTLPNLQANLISLLNQKNDLQLTLAKAKEFKLVELPIYSKPIKPNKKLNIATSIIVSLIFGVFLAFFIEYWEKSKK